jgi:uncharacterized protein DUF5666
MLDETPPFASDPIGRDVPPAEGPAAAEPASRFSGRTPGRASAVRAGVLLGAGVVVALGAAVVLGASPGSGAAPSGAGAGPSAAPSARQGADNENGPRGLRGFTGIGPFAFGFPPGNPGKGDPGDRLGGGRFGQITVTAVDGSSVSLKTADGWTRTITVTADTKVTKGGEPATAADIEVGDAVRIGQKRNDDGSYTVTAVAIVLPRVGGTVSAVDASTITITDRQGARQTVHTTGATVYHAGGAAGTRADVTVGSRIVAVGEQGSDGSLTATSVTVDLPKVAGTIDSVSGDTITLTDRKGTKHTIHVTSATTIVVFGTGKATVADLKAGMVIGAEGRLRSDGSLDATAIGAGTPGQRGKGVKPGSGDHAAPSAAPSGTTG